jgi:hypothetical protein
MVTCHSQYIWQQLGQYVRRAGERLGQNPFSRAGQFLLNDHILQQDKGADAQGHQPHPEKHLPPHFLRLGAGDGDAVGGGQARQHKQRKRQKAV